MKISKEVRAKERAMKIVNDEILRDKTVEEITDNRFNKTETRIAKLKYIEYEDFARTMDYFHREIRLNFKKRNEISMLIYNNCALSNIKEV